jgi:RHS repeat-associated protein
MSYDALDRLTYELLLDAIGTPVHTITSTYDAASQLTNISDPNSRYSYQYDAVGQLLQVTSAGTPGVPTVVFDYAYDQVGNRLSVTDTFNGIQQGVETFTYDVLNRMVQITQTGPTVTSKRVNLTYDAASQLTGIQRYRDLAGTQSVVNSTYAYDTMGRLTQLQHLQGASSLANYGFTYDAANRLTQFNQGSNSSAYNYDARGQLLGTDNSTQTDEAYSYDANGNRTNNGYQTGSNNQLLSDGVYTYTYDNEGNRTSRTHIATGEVTEYAWDYHNRLTRNVFRATAGGSITRQVDYMYDVFDRRIAKVVDLDGEGAQTPTTERFVYDGEHIALVFDGNGTLRERYLHGPQVDQVLAGDVNGQTQWYLGDHQGSVRQIVDNTGTLLNQIEYDSYGNITSQSNPSVTFRFGYTGREWDSETGQYYYRARYYDAGVGRFISQDPIGFAAGDANLYRYVGNSPTNFIDPSGKTGVGWQVTSTGLGITQVDGPFLPFGDAVGLPIAVLGGGIMIYEEYTYIQEHWDPKQFRRGTAPVTPPPSHTGHPRQTAAPSPNDINRPTAPVAPPRSHTGSPALPRSAAGERLGGFCPAVPPVPRESLSRSVPPKPRPEAEGREHTIIERPGPEGQYTTHYKDGTWKQYRGSGKDHGSIARPNVKETKIERAPNGKEFIGKPKVRKPEPGEIPGGN